MSNSTFKCTKLYCLRQNNLFVAWDGKTLVERPSLGIRLSKTKDERLYPGFELIPFKEAYEQWYMDRHGENN
jgi:hypothetical protein